MASTQATAMPRLRASHTSPAVSTPTTATATRCRITRCGAALNDRTNNNPSSTAAAVPRRRQSANVPWRLSNTHTSTNSPTASIGSTRAGQRNGPMRPGPAVHIRKMSTNNAAPVYSRHERRTAAQSMKASNGIRNQAM